MRKTEKAVSYSPPREDADEIYRMQIAMQSSSLRREPVMRKASAAQPVSPENFKQTVPFSFAFWVGLVSFIKMLHSFKSAFQGQAGAASADAPVSYTQIIASRRQCSMFCRSNNKSCCSRTWAEFGLI